MHAYYFSKNANTTSIS